MIAAISFKLEICGIFLFNSWIRSDVIAIMLFSSIVIGFKKGIRLCFKQKSSLFENGRLGTSALESEFVIIIFSMFL